MIKEFVCVSQGVEIYRTKSQEDAINFVKESNDEWFDYAQRCEDNYEDYADNYVELFIEYEDIEKLKVENIKLKEEIKAVNRGLRKVISKSKKWKDRYYREREKINELKKENKHGSKKDV